MIDSPLPVTPASPPTSLSTGQLFAALGIAALFSLVIAFVQMMSESKRSWKACLTLPSFLYFLLLLVGDAVTTLIASALVVKLPANLAPFYSWFSAFFGVFGFEVVLKNTNITIFDKGVLTIQAWIDKALSIAAAAVIEGDTRNVLKRQGKLAEKLARTPEPELNAFVSLTAKLKTEDLNAAADREAADRSLYKALAAVAAVSNDAVEAFLRRKEN